MNWADWVIIALIVVSALLSLRRGFIKEALSLVTWVSAFVVARLFADQLSTVLAAYIDTPSARIVAAFILLFVVFSLPTNVFFKREIFKLRLNLSTILVFINFPIFLYLVLKINKKSSTILFTSFKA